MQRGARGKPLTEVSIPYSTIKIRLQEWHSISIHYVSIPYSTIKMEKQNKKSWPDKSVSIPYSTIKITVQVHMPGKTDSFNSL